MAHLVKATKGKKRPSGTEKKRSLSLGGEKVPTAGMPLMFFYLCFDCKGEKIIDFEDAQTSSKSGV